MRAFFWSYLYFAPEEIATSGKIYQIGGSKSQATGGIFPVEKIECKCRMKAHAISSSWGSRISNIEGRDAPAVQANGGRNFGRARIHRPTKCERMSQHTMETIGKDKPSPFARHGVVLSRSSDIHHPL